MLPWCSGLALQAALSSVPLWSPFVGFLADRIPVDLEREEAVYVSYSDYWKWAARLLAGILCEEAVPRAHSYLGTTQGIPLAFL